MKINLSTLAKELAAIDQTGKKELTISQIREVIACLGIHMRRLVPEDAFRTAHCIIDRAGVKSKNPKRP